MRRLVGFWTGPLLTGAAAALLAAVPAPLVAVARLYQALCARFPVLAQATVRVPPLVLALLLGLAAAALLAGTLAAASAVAGTRRFERALRRQARPVPARLARVAARLDLADRLTYLARPTPAACCYGLRRPRIAVTAGLLARLDDEELAAVLAHERHHLARRDPARYLALHAVAAAAFMVPLAPALRRRLETRIELAADRAALAVVPRGALAGALLAVLAGEGFAVAGVAGLSATEARIAHLAGRPIPRRPPSSAILASLGLVAAVAVAAGRLAAVPHVVSAACALCEGRV